VVIADLTAREVMAMAKNGYEKSADAPPRSPVRSPGVQAMTIDGV
jgi:hypothetical protein